MDQNPATPLAAAPSAARSSLLMTWPHSVQLAVALLLAMGVGFLLSRSFASDPVRLEASPSERDEATPHRSGPRLDLNRATRAELALLPGVGPSRAQSIDDYRRQHGDFRAIDDLRKVPGIGPKTMEKVRGSLFIGEVADADVLPPPSRVTAPVRSTSASPAKSKKETALKAPIDVNHANATELQRLPGIGPKLSQRIIDERTLHGPFKTVDELRRVPGIGPKTLEKLRPHVVASGAG